MKFGAGGETIRRGRLLVITYSYLNYIWRGVFFQNSAQANVPFRVFIFGSGSDLSCPAKTKVS